MVAVLRSMNRPTTFIMSKISLVVTDRIVNEKNRIDRLLVCRRGAARGLPEEGHDRRVPDHGQSGSGGGW